MKKFMLLTALIVLTSMTACHHGMFNRVSGSGNRQKQKRDVAPFNSISTDGEFEIDIVCQQSVSLEIEGDDNLLPLVGTEVSNNILHIKSTSGYSAAEPIKLKISVPVLESIAVNGAGRIEISGVKNEKFEVHANGAPTIRVSGETRLVDIDMNGAGKIDTFKLRASKAIVESRGVSSVAVRAVDHLDVTISGASTVTYEGDPVVNKTVHGPGNVEKKGSSGNNADATRGA